MNPTSNPNLDPIVTTITATTPTPGWSRMLMVVALPIVLPGSLMLNAAVPLPVQGVSAVVCGLPVLLCGSSLMSHALVAWARRN